MNKSALTNIMMLVTIIVISFAPALQARNLKAALGLNPVLAESPDKGLLVEYVKALDKVYKGIITIDVYPNKRALDNVIKGTHDFMLPMLKTEAMMGEKVPFRFFESLWTSIFLLYSNKNKPGLTPSTVARYKVEAERNLIGFFKIKFMPSNNVVSSLRKVNLGRVDGYIFSMVETDTVLKKLRLKNIRRQVYKRYDGPITVTKGPRGDEVERILRPLIKILRKNGQHQKILKPLLNQRFVKW